MYCFNCYFCKGSRKKRKMEKEKRQLPVVENVEITDAGAEGKAVAKINDKIVFIPYGAPGDVVDIQIFRKKKNYLEAKIIKFHKYSELRTEPICEHYGVCGGCKWQHLKYETQLSIKQNQVENNLKRIGKIDLPAISPIIASEKTTCYRNKLEYTFSCHRWLTNDEIKNSEIENQQALGFHLPGRFDKILDVNFCHLQPEPSNAIRLAAKKIAVENNLQFLNSKTHQGFLRNIIIRNTSSGEWMVIVIFNENNENKINDFLEKIKIQFSKITSLMYVVNTKFNDDLSDQGAICYYGKNHLTEKLENLIFKIGPLSFFQTNTDQALRLYQTVRDFCMLTGKETVYDLYTGTGTIANFVAHQAEKVVGIEYVEVSISNAKENSILNNIKNTSFFAGDIAKTLNDEFIFANEKPDVVITDPPRSGMHPDVIAQLIKTAPLRIVYVSCNPATQARDIELMKEYYTVSKVQPVDMFPHTHHVENVVLLEKRMNKNI